MRASTSRTRVRVVGPAVAIALVTTLSLGGCGSGADDAGGDAAAEPAAGAPAGAASAVDADVADVSEYTLTMDRMDRYFAAMANVERAMQNVPEEEREDVVGASGAVSIDDYAAALERNPAVRDAIREAGLSAREFGLITMAYLQAGMASAVLAMRPNENQDSLAREMKTNMANIKFLQENQAALEAKMQQAGMGAGSAP
jgi:hypothetical protein